MRDDDRRRRPVGRVAGVATVLCAALVGPAALAGCTTTSGAPTGPEAAVAELDRITNTRNDADVAFVQDMLPHHTQGVEVADLVTTRTETLPVRDLAFRITRAQGFEIAQLRGFLTAWRLGPGVGDMTGMAGMVPPDRMDSLRQARGPVFDRLWLEAMIAHHEGAIAMAEAQQRAGINRGARNTAANVISVQRSEIATMRALLAG